MVTLEVCAYSLGSCINAQNGGAARIELCADPSADGTTPSIELIRSVRQAIDIKLHVMVRPRGGDFVFSATEVEQMVADIKMAHSCGADGVVFGCLTAKGGVDVKACGRLMEAAQGMSTTFHRAFDVVGNQFTALEDIISLGFDRILTSGGEATAPKGADVIGKLIEVAGGRIIIMPGCGVNCLNIKDLALQTKAPEFHSSARPLSSVNGNDEASVDMVENMIKALSDV